MQWASSASSASASRIGSHDLRGLDRRLGDQQAHRRQLAGIAGAHAALLLGGLISAASGVDQDLLAGAEPLGDVDHRQLGRLVQHRHDHVVAAQIVRPPRRSAATSASRPTPAAGTRVQRADDPAGQQRRQDRPGVGPAPVDRRPADPRRGGRSRRASPGRRRRRCTQSAAASRMRSLDVGDASLLIDIICNTVTHDAIRTPQTALPPMKWNAWGDPAAAKPLSDGIRIAAQAGARRRGVDEPPKLERRPGPAAAVGAVARPTATALAAIVGAEYCVVDDRGRLLRAGGKSTLDLLRRKDSGVQDAPDAVLLPADEDEIAGDPAVLRATAASRSSRSAAAPAWSAASTRSAATSRPWSRWTCGGSTQLHSLDEVSGEAELGAGRHRTRRRATARRARLLARPLPAELPVRHHRRLRRDALVGPGLGGLRPLQRHGPRPARGHPGGRARPRPRAGVRGRARTCGS